LILTLYARKQLKHGTGGALMAEYIDIVGIKQAVNKGEMQAFVRDGSIYLQCKVSGECVKIGDTLPLPEPPKEER
jgi:hypothetical protein